MKAIRITKPFLDGYIEVEYFNHSRCGWRRFEADPRKRQAARPKFWWRTGSFGAVDQLCGSTSFLCGVSSSYREEAKEMLSIAQGLLMEAARRYDRRYSEFGELGNAQMPMDPEKEEVLGLIAETAWRNLLPPLMPD